MGEPANAELDWNAKDGLTLISVFMEWGEY
jgi:hypothetical protein